MRNDRRRDGDDVHLFFSVIYDPLVVCPFYISIYQDLAIYDCPIRTRSCPV